MTLRRAWVAVAIAAVLAFPWAAGSYVNYVTCLALTYSLVTLSLNWVTGYAGQITLGQGGFFAVGAYLTAAAVVHAGWPLPAAILLSAVATGALGLLLGVPALRLQGHYLALATLFFSLAVPEAIMALPSLTGGANGINVPPSTTFFGLHLSNLRDAYYVLIALVTLVVLVDRTMLRSKLGRAFLAIRDSETAAASVGIPIEVYKVTAFTASGVIAGLAGGLYGSIAGYLNPATFDLWLSIYFFAALIVGGLGNVYGAVIGGILVVALPQLFSQAQNLANILYGAILVVVLLTLPGGVADWPRLSRAVRWLWHPR
ncbi:branched-chain amino acid ABC transporter permease [bacterium]|nr:MAG: branched-chain amino acid ABC transporter permease [bacterium]